MKKKKLLIACLTVTFFFSALVPSVWARDKNQYRWEGVAIGLGAAILGHAIISSSCGSLSGTVHVYESSPPVYYAPPPPVYYAPPAQPQVYYAPPPPPPAYYVLPPPPPVYYVSPPPRVYGS